MTDLTTLAVLAAPCPDCLAPETEECRFSNPAFVGSVHANRRDRARWRLAERGTCDLCGQEMLRAENPLEAWHPAGMAQQCPPEPSTNPYDAPGWMRFLNSGLRSGRPGAEHFVPSAELDAQIDRLHGPGAAAAIDAAHADGSIFGDD